MPQSMNRVRRRGLTLKAGVLGGGSYLQQVLTTSPIALWPLNEGSGSTIFDKSGNSYNGTYTGVTWDSTTQPKDGLVPFWDGANDFGNVYSAAFASAFNFDEFTILLWLKVASAGFWTDGLLHAQLRFWRDASNEVRIQKSTTNNLMQFQRIGGGTTKIATYSGASDTDFIAVAISCSIVGGGLLSAGDLRAYKNGTQVGTTQTGNIAATGSGINSGITLLGATLQTPTGVHHGYLGFVIIWNRPMANDILALMV